MLTPDPWFRINNFDPLFSFRNFKQTPEADDHHEQELELEAGGAARIPGHRHQRRSHRDSIPAPRTDQER